MRNRTRMIAAAAAATAALAAGSGVAVASATGAKPGAPAKTGSATGKPGGPAEEAGDDAMVAAVAAELYVSTARVSAALQPLFAVGHTITQLCASLGLCPRHTRGLLGQPGADARLTVVYRYVLHAAKAHLEAGTSPYAFCPACARETAAADRALATLLNGIREQEIRHRYREHGGLCIPHLRTAVGRRRHRQAAWLAHTALARLMAGPPPPELLAGESDADAGVRARLRAALPPGGPGLCVICLAAAHAERDLLSQVIGGQAAESRLGLCPPHLLDALASLASPPHAPNAEAAGLLVREAAGWTAWLNELASKPAKFSVRPLTPWRGPHDARTCPACEAREATDLFHTERLRGVLRASHVALTPGLCLRHVMSLRKPGQAGNHAVRTAIGGTDLLMAELDEAFRKRMWAHRHETRGPEMTAWRRAAAFVDGRVYGGGPSVRL